MIPKRGDGPMDLGYARVSTLDQDLTIQLAALDRAGCHPIYQEKVSGAAKTLPVRDQLLGQLRRNDTLTTTKLDRLGRSMTEVMRIIEGLEQRGVRYRCTDQVIDTGSPSGRLQLQLLASFAEFERAMILERTRAGKARRMAEGKHPGGPPLFGYQADHETIHPNEAAMLAEVAQMILDKQMNLGQVVDHINAHPDAYPRPRRRGHWYVTALRRVLTNPRIEAVIPDHYHDLQAILKRNEGKGQGQGGGRPADHLLSGILTCARCGQPMYAANKVGKTGVPQKVYRCKKETGSGGRFAGCGQTQVSEARADAWAAEAFVAAVLSPAFADALNQRRAELLAGEVTVDELDAWRQEMAEIEIVLPTRFGTPDLRRRHDELRRMVDQATARLLAAPDLQALLDLPQSEELLRAAWDGWSIVQRRAWLRRLLSEIVVHPPTARRGPATDVAARLDPQWRL